MDRKNGPSETFENVVRDGGSLVIDCELCGRTHFATLEEGPFYDGELAELRAKAAKEPDKYIEDKSYDTVSWGHIGGKQAVIGCPCNKLREIEDLIWKSRHQILEYLERRTKAMLEGAREAADHVDQVKKVMNHQSTKG